MPDQSDVGESPWREVASRRLGPPASSASVMILGGVLFFRTPGVSL